ncbi:MAG: response regulator [Candidatus Omnitrophica bacterium]|nr:response regulator [Candidatus Omnitrophota bacterium]
MEKKRILIIDDEKGFTKLVKLNLEQTGNYEVIVENEGKKSFDTAKRIRPDLILLDIMMPEMDGTVVAQMIKADNTLEETPVVFLTSIVKEDEISSRGDNIGGYPFIAKSVNFEKLIEIIERHI